MNSPTRGEEMKEHLPRITEPSSGLVHYRSAPLGEGVTLCGLTDFLGGERGERTDAAVTCNLCVSIVTYCRSAHP